MKVPRGVLKPGEEGKVLRLLKGLYGLKQAGRGWYIEMTRVFIKELGFEQSEIDPSVYYRRKGEEHTIVAVATDDMALTSKHAEDAQRFKTEIKKFWYIMDHRPIKWFLGFEIKRDQDARTLAISQQAYIEGMVERFGMAQAKLVLMPMEPGVQFSVDQCLSSANQVARMCGVPYIQALGVYCGP